MATQPVTGSRDGFVIGCVIALGVLLVFSFLGVMFSESPEWAFCLFGVSEKLEILKFLGVGMGGVLLALQVLMSHKRAKAMEDAARAQAKATEEQAQANLNTEQGQRQERLKNAIDHLGHGSVAVRLGGAYELFHLAQDAQEFRQSVFSRLVQDTKELLRSGSHPLNTHELRQTVHDILCSHIRETTTEDKYLERYQSAPSTEIQSLLTLLFVQGHEVFRGLRANLVGSCLKGAGLQGARLRGAVLTEARLQGAFLRNARLQGAFLRAAHLQLADLRDAQLQGAILHFAKLQGADMKGARLQGASLGGAGLQAAALQGVQLQGAKVFTSGNKKSSPTFTELITGSIGQQGKLFDEPELSGAAFSGGLSSEDRDTLVERLSDEGKDYLQSKLNMHIDLQISRRLPENSGATTGTYTEKEAKTWIAEYKEDM